MNVINLAAYFRNSLSKYPDNILMENLRQKVYSAKIQCEHARKHKKFIHLNLECRSKLSLTRLSCGRDK